MGEIVSSRAEVVLRCRCCDDVMQAASVHLAVPSIWSRHRTPDAIGQALLPMQRLVANGAAPPGSAQGLGDQIVDQPETPFHEPAVTWAGGRGVERTAAPGPRESEAAAAPSWPGWRRCGRSGAAWRRTPDRRQGRDGMRCHLRTVVEAESCRSARRRRAAQGLPTQMFRVVTVGRLCGDRHHRLPREPLAHQRRGDDRGRVRQGPTAT